MKIGYDGKRAAQNFTGLGNYSRYALAAISSNYPEEEYLIYLPKDITNEKLEELIQVSNGHMRKVFPLSRFNKKNKSFWRVCGITKDIKRDKIDIFHGLSNELPLTIDHLAPAIKSVVTIHDLIFLRFPSYYPLVDRYIYNYKFRKACINADHIIAVSECTKRDIVSYYGISPEKISVIYQGCDPIFSTPVDESRKAEIREKYSLPEKYIVSVGSIEERKNLLSVVKALIFLPKDVHLVAVGKRTKYTATIEDFVKLHNLQERVHILSSVQTHDLPAIYQCADVFAYMSVYEGFGIPLLEALHSRIPVIAATGSCLEESGGTGSKYVAPYDIIGIADAVKECMKPEVREVMVNKGLEWVRKFTPDIFASETMRVYKKILGEGKR